MRVQGGTCGIISALFSGRLDPFNANWERRRICELSSQDSDRRARIRRRREVEKFPDRLRRLYLADMI